ncbi:MAG: prepilin-type N-terminal cleavage/methylation domain-containing protein [Deltaproteobacteria bacterium]|nr:prepilin-type N-terminal cleavage/methylation domain-containing protein [Deltaproteobacteria bacterium]
MDKKGFTIIELVFVLILMAVVAAVASPMIFRGPSSVTTPALARKIRDDIRYAQSLALIRSNLDSPASTEPAFLYRISFNTVDASCTGTNRYSITNDADRDNNWGENPNESNAVESARSPATGQDYYCVQMDSGDYSGFTISADFGGSAPGVLEFDNSGIPYDSDGVKLTASKSVVVSKGGQTETIVVTPNTGMVSIQ